MHDITPSHKASAIIGTPSHHPTKITFACYFEIGLSIFDVLSAMRKERKRTTTTTSRRRAPSGSGGSRRAS